MKRKGKEDTYETEHFFVNETGLKGMDFFFIMNLIMVLVVPVIVLPNILDNAFNTPKNLVILISTSLMVVIYSIRFLSGKGVIVSKATTGKILLILIFLNLFSFFYTKNYYYTTVAAMMNITCLLAFYFISLYTDSRRALILVIISTISGIMVSIVTYLQFMNIFILFKWAYPGIMVMGTIGNSNYLGAYLMFPLFTSLALIFITNRFKYFWGLVFIFIMGAFLFSRARAGWMGFFLSFPLFLYFIKRIFRFSLLGYIKTNPRKVATAAVTAISVITALWFFAPERLHTQMKFKNVTQSQTLKLRMKKYYRASFWLFEQNPLYGTGLWSYRNMVYKAQAEINKEDPDFFKNYPEPKPRRVHTDYLEILNDGGLMAASALSLFLLLVLKHGWMVIRKENLSIRDRIICAMAFSATISVMLNAVFFFPFRINSTMFMTVFMMGLMEALYLRNYSMLNSIRGWVSPTRYINIPLVVLVLGGFVWFTGIKPFKGEMEHYKYKRAMMERRFRDAEKFILRAIEYDPHNTAYCLYASQLYMNVLKDFGKARDFIEKAIIDFNGDVTRWSIYFIKGLLKFQMGSLFDAKAAFEKALYYNPEFSLARQKLNEVNKVIKEHDRVLIKFR